MKKILIVGKDSQAKSTLAVSLNSIFDVTNLLPEQITIDKIFDTDLVIYVTEGQIDNQILERLRWSGKLIALMSTAKSTAFNLFLQIKPFCDINPEGISRGIQLVKDFFYQSITATFTEDQQEVWDQLANGLSDDENIYALSIGRTKYFIILAQLRMMFDVKKNWQLTQLAKHKFLAFVS
jgi:hypothetical protein